MTDVQPEAHAFPAWQWQVTQYRRSVFDYSQYYCLFTVYGMTESSCMICGTPAGAPVSKVGSAGVPVPGVEMKVGTVGLHEACRIATPGLTSLNNHGSAPSV